MDFKEVTIIEPHSDDAWLGLGGYILLNPNTQFRIITLVKNEYENKTQYLSKALKNVENVFLDYPDIEWDGKRDEINNSVTLREYYSSKVDPEKLKSDILRNAKGTIINCSGYRHPFHFLVNQLVQTEFYYAEFPYYYNRSSWCKHIRPRQYTPWRQIDTSKVNKEWNYILSQVYKNQIKTFWFFKPYYKNHNYEMLLKESI